MEDRKYPEGTVIVLSGKKKRGKDTFAEFLADEMFVRCREVASIALATPLKKAAMEMFRLTQDQVENQQAKEIVDERCGMTPREILQKLGTEVGRTFDQDIWVKAGIMRIKDTLLSGQADLVVVPDCRFPNEIERLRDAFADRCLAVRIERKLPPTPFDGHPSEISLDQYDHWDDVIDNNGTLDDFRAKVVKFVDRRFGWSLCH